LASNISVEVSAMALAIDQEKIPQFCKFTQPLAF
jgi:hypothetical protein